MKAELDEAAIKAISRPDPALWTYYLLSCLVIPPLFPLFVLPAYFRYHTMRYRFDDEGISMSWGILFRREVIVNYARIQDIHLRSNIVERWLGLAKILIQTASGSSSAEMTIEGVKEFEPLRDFLYSRMRGVKDHSAHPASQAAHSTNVTTAPSDTPELAAVLREVTTELKGLRQDLAASKAAARGESPHV